MAARKSGVSAILIALVSFCFAGCLEHQVRTTIHADGSSERIVTVSTESQEVPSSCFPLPVNGGWDTAWTKTGDARYALSFTKEFAEPEALSHEYAQPGDSAKIRVGIVLQKTFSWFTTRFEYREAYRRFTDYTLVDPRTVLSEEEMKMLTYGDSSETLKNKKEEWIARNLFEALYCRFARGAASLNDTLLSPEKLTAHKEELFRTLVGYTAPGLELKDPEDILRNLSSYRGTKVEMFAESGVTAEGLNAFAEIATRVFKTDATWKLRDSVRAGWQDVLKLVGGRGTTGESFTNTVILPGTLIETNAPRVVGNEVSWKFGVDQLMLRDFDMLAQSRVVNVWAIAVTSIAVLALLGLLISSLARRRRRAVTI